MKDELIRPFLVVAFGAALTACSGGSPSEADMKEAMLLAFSPMVGKDAELVSFEGGDCTKLEAAYRCKVKGTLAYTLDLGGRNQDKTQAVAGQYTFTHTDKGWRLVR